MKIFLVIFLVCFLSGCYTPFFSSTQGTVINAGLSLPTESALDIQIVSYLSGEKVSVREKSDIEYQFKMSETNSYFYGLITTEINRNGKIKVK